MRKHAAAALLIVSILTVTALPLSAEIREEFDDLDRWEVLTFRKIDAHTAYDLISEDGRGVLRVDEETEINGLDVEELGMEAYPEFGKAET